MALKNGHELRSFMCTHVIHFGCICSALMDIKTLKYFCNSWQPAVAPGPPEFAGLPGDAVTKGLVSGTAGVSSFSTMACIHLIGQCPCSSSH